MIELDYNAGFVRMRRAVYVELRRNAVLLQVWAEIEHRARWHASGPMLGARGRVFDLDVGQAALGRAEFAETIGVTEDQVRTAIKALTRLGIIIPTSIPGIGTVVTLVGFKESAGITNADSPAKSPPRSPGGPQLAPTNKTGDVPDLLSSSGPEPRRGGRGDRDRIRRGPRPTPPTAEDIECRRLLDLPALVRTPKRPDETHGEWCAREERDRHALQYGAARGGPADLPVLEAGVTR